MKTAIRRVVATAPGKLILMGEHAAVYGRPAVVAALGLRSEVVIEATAGGVELDLPTIDHLETLSWEAIDSYAEAYRERWRSFDRRATPEAFARLADADPARVVKLALGEGRRLLSALLDGGVRLRVRSEIPVGAGFGSSASVAVAVAGALLAFAGELVPGAEASAGETLSSIALEVERRQHGRPSGVDHQTVLRGGILRLAPGGGRRAVPIAATAGALASLRVFDTGRPTQTTGEVVASVRALHDADRDHFDRRLDEMEEATRGFAAALGAADGEPALLASIRAFERRLEELGVVPAAVRRAVREVERRGGAAKLSGAGALTGRHGGALVVAWPRAAAGAAADALPGYPCHRAAIGAPGFRIEESA